MKRLIVSFCVTFSLGLTATTYGQDDAPLSDGAVAIYNIIADSPDAYAETQRDNSQLFEEMGILIAGVCTAISGNENQVKSNSSVCFRASLPPFLV